MAKLAPASKPEQLNMTLLVSAILLTLVTSVVAGPALVKEHETCASFCKESSKFLFTPGRKYIYDYKADISTSSLGSSSEESRVHIFSTVELTAFSACDLQLKLKNVKLEESEPQNKFARYPLPKSSDLIEAIQERALRFSYQDGQVEHICSDNEEQTWILNIKRGILSTIQNTMQTFSKPQSLQETDINGNCFTKYESKDQSVIKKIKDLKRCSNRQSHISSIQSVPYTSSSPVQNIPVLSGSLECVQVVRNKQIVKVDCQENHKFQPFDSSHSGAQTLVTQSLEFKMETPSDSQNNEHVGTKVSSLLFEISTTTDSAEQNIAFVFEILEKLENESVPKITLSAPDRFIELVRQLRKINSPALKSLFQKSENSVKQKYFLDAIPLVGSAPALEFMVGLYSEGKLSEPQIDSWLTSLSFLKYPDIEMISALEPLLEGNPRNQALLGISSIIFSYCKQHQSCMEETPVQNSLRRMYSLLGSSCKISNSNADLTKMIVVLKAIGNSGQLLSENDDKYTKIINKCFRDSSNPTEIRLAAIDIFRRVQCDQYPHKQLVDLYADMSENTEVRIHSYLMAMKCPDRELIDTVKDILYTDAVNQVSSFVWTHLTNIQETTSPDKQGVRELLSNDFLKKKFETDARKFSRNYEVAKFWEEQNIGAGVDANLIFSPDSFVPRSAMVNLTGHLFGETINLLEFGARVHSLEQLLEPIFGPNGYFPDKTVNEALYSLRNKREVQSNDLDRLNSVYQQATEQDRNAGASIYSRIFGNEIMYKNFEIYNHGSVPTMFDEGGTNWFDITHLFDNLSVGKSMEYTKSNVLADSSYTVATSAGIPLTLGVQSAATVSMKANGKVDLSNFWENKEVDIQAMMKPSGTIQVDGTMSVKVGDGHLKLESGIRFQGTLHTSTAVQGRLVIKNSQVVHASLTLPENKQEIVTAKTQLLLLRPSGEFPITPHSSASSLSETKSCTSQGISTVLGLQLCSEMSFLHQDSGFSFMEPSALSVYVEKTDTFDSYEFDYKWSAEDEEVTDVSILLNTPGSTVDRRLAASLYYDRALGKLEGKLEGPSKSLHVEGKYSDASQSLQLTILSQRQQVLLFSTALRAQGNRLEPYLLLTFYESPVIEVQGIMDSMSITDPEMKANYELNIKHVTQVPIKLTGEIVRSGEVYETNLSLQSFLATGNIRSQIRAKKDSISTKSELQYSWKSKDTKTYNINGRVQNSKKGTLSKYTAAASATSGQNRDENVEFSWETQHTMGYAEHAGRLTMGKTTYEGKYLYKNQANRNGRDFHLLASLTSPKALDYKVEFIHKRNDAGLVTKLTGRTDPRNEAQAQLEYITRAGRFVQKSLNAELSWPENVYSVRSSLKEIRPKEFEGEVTIVPNKATEKKASLSYKNGSTRTKVDHTLQIRARGFSDAPIYSTASVAASDRKSYVKVLVELEGQSDRRWSVNLDYNATKKNNQKVEGKLTYGEKKYNGEINYRKTKSGDRTVVVDLQLDKHFYSELSIKQPNPATLFGSFQIVPNLDQEPTKKAILEGTLKSDSAEIRLDYYGKVYGASGIHSPEKYQLELEWEPSKRASVSVAVPSCTLKSLNIISSLELPVEGLKNIGFTIKHSLTDTSLETFVQGNVGASTGSVSMNGVLNKDQSVAAIQFEFPNMEKIRGGYQLVKKGESKLMQLTYESGVKKTVLEMEHVSSFAGFDNKMSFSGCQFIPQVSTELNFKNSKTFESKFILNWISKDSDNNKIVVELSHNKKPLEYKFLMSSPWESLNRIEGQLLCNEEKKFHSFKLQANGELEILPINLDAKLNTNREAFKHEVIASWSESRKPKRVSLTSEGHYLNYRSAKIITEISVPNHELHLELTSKKDGNGEQKMEYEGNFDGKRIAGGTQWKYENEGKVITSSVWAQYLNRPKFIFSFEHLRNPNTFVFKSSIKQGENENNNFGAELYHEGLKKWDLKVSLNSAINMIPNVQISSKHTMDGFQELQHSSSVVLSQKSTKRWGGKEGIQGAVDFSIRNGKQVKGMFTFNEQQINLDGEVIFDQNSKKVDLELTSPLFATTQVMGEWTRKNQFHRIILIGNRSNKELLNLKAEGGVQSNGIISTSIYFNCPYGHEIEAEGSVNFNANSVKLRIHEKREHLINLSLNAEVKDLKGTGSMSLESKLHPKLSKVNTDFDFQVEANSFSANGKFVNMGQEYSVNFLSLYSPDQLKVVMKVNEAEFISFSGQLLEGSIVKTIIFYKGGKLIEINAQYRMSKEDYNMGKHTIDAEIVLDKAYDLSITLGADTEKLLLDVETPFAFCKKLTGSGKFRWMDEKKYLGVSLLFDEKQYDGTFESQSSSKINKTAFKINTQFQGYSSMGMNIQTSKAPGREIKVETFIENNKINFFSQYAYDKVEIRLETPFQRFQSIQFLGAWKQDSEKNVAEFRAQLNQFLYEARIEWMFKNGIGIVNGNISGLEKGDFRMNYDFSKDYKVNASMEFSGKRHNVGFELLFGAEDVKIEFRSPFPGLVNLSGKLEHYSLSKDHHRVLMEWNINGKSNRILGELTAKPQSVQFKLETPLYPHNTLIGSLDYDLSTANRLVGIKLERGDGKRLEASLGATVPDDLFDNKFQGNGAIEFKMTTPFHNLKSVIFEAVYSKKSEKRDGKVLLAVGDTQFVGNLMMESRDRGFELNFDAEVEAQSLGIPKTRLTSSASSSTKDGSSFSGKLSHNGKEYSADGKLSINPSQWKVESRTSFFAIKKIEILVDYSSNKNIIYTVQINEKKVEMNVKYDLDTLRHSKVVCEIQTPFEGYRNIYAEAQANVQNTLGRLTFIFQNDRVRYMGKLDGVYSEETGEIKLQINSPIYRMEQVLGVLKFDNSGIQMKLIRNTKEEFIFQVNLKENQLVADITSQIPSLPINSNVVLDWGTGSPVLKAMIDAGTGHRKITVRTMIEGLYSGDVKIETPFKDYEILECGWSLNGNMESGFAMLKYNFASLGQNSLRSSWKKDNFEAVNLELWVKRDGDEVEKGFSAQYSLSNFKNGNGKLGASLSYIIDGHEEHATLITSAKSSDTSNIIEVTLQTPFQKVKEVTISCRFSLQPEMTVDLSASHNQMKVMSVSSAVLINPVSSRFKLNFSVPTIYEPFILDAKYDLSTSEKFLEVFFVQNKYKLNVKAQAIVPANPQEVELRMTVDSNIPSVTVSASGSVRAGYKIEQDGTRTATVSVDSIHTGHWQATGGYKPSPNFNAKFKLQSPAPERFPGIKTDFQWNKNKESLNSEIIIQIGVKEARSSLVLGSEKFRLSFNSGIQGFEEILLDGKITSESNGDKQANVDIRAAGERITLEARIPADKLPVQSFIKLVSSVEAIPNASLELSLTESGLLKVNGKSGDHSFAVDGTFSKVRDFSLLEAAESQISISLESTPVFDITAHHLFSKNQYSVNFTTGEMYSFNSFAKLNEEVSLITTTFQWAEGQLVKMFADAEDGRFSTSVSTPWTSHMELNGKYKVSKEEYSAQGDFTYDGKRSGLETRVLVGKDSFTSEIFVNVPILNQKIDCKINIHKPDEENVNGLLEMNLSDRQVSVKGSLTTKNYKSNVQGNMQEQNLKLSFSLPGYDYPEVSTDIVLRKPVSNNKNMELEGTLHLPTGDHKIRLRGQLPTKSINEVSADWFIDSEFLSMNQLKGSIEAKYLSYRKLDWSFRLRNNEVRLFWDLGQHYQIEVSAFFPMILVGSTPFRFLAEGTMDPKHKMTMKSSLLVSKHETNMDLSFVNGPNGIEISIYVESPQIMTEPKEITAKLTKVDNMRYVYEMSGVSGKHSIALTTEYTKLENIMSLSTKLSGAYGIHFIQLTGTQNKNSYELECGIESLSLLNGKKVLISGKFHPLLNGFVSNIECRTKKSLHSIDLTVDIQQRLGNIFFKLNSPNLQPVVINTHYDCKNGKSRVKAMANIQGEAHNIELKFNKQEMEGKLNVNSAYIPSKIAVVHIKALTNKNDVSIIVDVNINKSKWRFELTGMYDHLRNMEAKLEFMTPFRSLDRFTLSGKLKSDEAKIEIYTPIEDIPNCIFEISGIPLFEPIDYLHIQPKAVIGLPWATFTSSGKIQVPDKETPGQFSVMYEQHYLDEEADRYMVSAHVSPTENISFDMDEPVLIKFVAETPIEGFKRLECQMGGNIQWKNWAEISASAGFNEHNIVLLSQIRNDAGSRKFTIELTTPLRGFERYAFAAHIDDYEEIGAGQSILLEFESPEWKTPFTVELEYRLRYNRLTNMDGELKLAAPMTEMPPLILTMKSQSRSYLYNGIIEGSWGEHRPVLSIEAGMTSDTIFTNIEGKAGEENSSQGLLKFEMVQKQDRFSLNTELQNNYVQILHLILGLSKEGNVIEGEARVKTSSQNLRSGSVLLRLSPIQTDLDSLTLSTVLTHLDVTGGISYNGKKVIHLEIVNKDGKRIFEIHNPYQPVSISVKLERENERFNINTELCWNLDKPLENTIGFGMSLDQTSAGYQANFKIHVPEKGVMKIAFDFGKTPKNLEQNFKMKWSRAGVEDENEIGYSFLMKEVSTAGRKKYGVYLGADLPWRTVELESEFITSSKLSSKYVELRWDSKNNKHKRLGGKLVEEKNTEWRSHTLRQTVTLIHSGLPNDLVFSVNRKFKQGAIQTLEMKFQPNSFPQDQLSFQFARDSVQNKEIQITLTHPSSNLDANLNFKQSDFTTSLYTSFMDIHGQKNVLSVEGTQDDLGMVLDVQTGTDTSLAQLLQLEFKPNEEQQTFTLKSGLCEVNAEIHNSLHHLKGSIKYESGREINFLVGLPYKREITLKIGRSEYGMNIRDLLMSVKLNTSRLLSTHFHWRPELSKDVKEFMTVQIPSWFNNLKDLHVPRLLAQLNEEIEERLGVVDPGISRVMDSLVKFSEHEFSLVKNEINRTIVQLKNMHSKNILFIKDITGMFGSVFDKIYEQYSQIVKAGKKVADFGNKFVVNSSSWIMELWKDYAGHFETSLMSAWEDLEEIIVRTWNDYTKIFSKMSSKLNEMYSSIARIFNINLDELEKRIRNIDFFQKIQKLYTDYSGWLEELPGQEYITDTKNWIARNIWIPVERYFKPYVLTIQQAVEERNVVTLLEMPPLPYFRFISGKLINTFATIWRFVEAEQRIKGLIRGILNKVDDLIQRNIPTASMVWELEKGNIEYHQPLRIFQWEDFTQMPQLQKSSEDAADVNQITEFYYSLLDTIRDTRPYLEWNMREILPPFGATATMAGDYHYLTFDKKYFRFAGECSYVLIADLLHQNFTLIANYETRGNTAHKKSYSLVTDNRQIEIDVDNFETTVDGRKAELPLEIGPTFVRREPSGLEIFDSRGFQMKCTLSPSVCSITVSGWYFGKLGGLLGTYDHEASNDMRTPDGQVLTDVANFAHSWRVGSNNKQCRMKNFAVEDSVGDVDLNGMCNELLVAKSSQYRPCFPVVDPTVYMEMCKHDVSRHKTNIQRQERVCSAVGAYVLECQRNGIDMWMPPACVKCQLEDGSTMSSGENVTLSIDGPVLPPSSADIVFLVEEVSSLKHYNLNDAISKLDSVLRDSGVADNRYAVIGYGGNSFRSTPHIRTSSGQVWSHNTAIKIDSNLDMDGPGNGDLYDAIQYAANIGYRVGVSKTIIAIVGDIATCGYESGYADSLTLLMENDFKLHILTPQDFAMKVTKKQDEASKILGIDMTEVYTLSHANRNTLEGDQALRRYVKVPKDLCTPLALETSGTMFNMNQMLQTTAPKFFEVWSKRVARTTKPSDCQRCECLPHRDGGALQLCHPCISPSLQKFIDDFNKLELDGELDMEFLETETK